MFKNLPKIDQQKEVDKLDRYVITYDYPTYPDDGTDSVIEALKKIGTVTEINPAPATTIGFTANAGIGSKKIASTIISSLDGSEPRRKVVIARISMKPGAWAWPKKDTAKAREEDVWRTIF